uniref:hypothetical protein n=1 Tax=uncultured Caulobacter sp. TaxID=158749 RepID=UPI0025D68712|nr:hypothetical protein [uncultured Caulobacter sp.]
MLAIFAAAALTLSPAEVRACVGASVDMTWTAIAEEKAKISSAAWDETCHQVRAANARRLSVARVIRETGVSPVGSFTASQRWVGLRRTASTPETAELFRLITEDQLARESLSAKKTPITAGLSPLAARIYDFVAARAAIDADAASRAWLRTTVARRGWFTISRDGAEADKAAQLIVQHADQDVAFKGEMIALLEPLVEAGDSDRAFFPYMYDRWAAQAGKPLRFGFQGACKSKGVWEPLSIEDPERLDERRRRFGVKRSFAEEKNLNGARCT